MSVLYVFISDGAEKEARFLENCKISWAMDLAVLRKTADCYFSKFRRFLIARRLH
ncbi:hypothetical protein T08_2824 [Trichinella sp. T8]|nr:hypothetical protein T08_2824 [Trichinella sp. T8]